MTGARTAVYTGSFDPITLGHIHIIERAAPLFDELVIGIGINADKKSLFEPNQRIELVRSVTGDIPNIRVEVFRGLAVDFVREIGSRVMIRGIRPLTDIAGEFTMMMANHQLDPEIETVFLMADERYAPRQQLAPEANRRSQRRRRTTRQVRPPRNHSPTTREADRTVGQDLSWQRRTHRGRRRP